MYCQVMTGKSPVDRKETHVTDYVTIPAHRFSEPIGGYFTSRLPILTGVDPRVSSIIGNLHTRPLGFSSSSPLNPVLFSMDSIVKFNRWLITWWFYPCMDRQGRQLY